MKPEEYDAILTRLEKLERHDRWLRTERLVMLAVIAWLLATGPVPARLLESVSAHVPTISAPRARVAADRGLAALRHALMANPVLDPQTVADDQREAFGPPSEVAVRSTAPPLAAAAKIAASPASTAAATPVTKIAATPVIKSEPVARVGGLPQPPSRVDSGSPAASASRAIAAQAPSAPARLTGAATLPRIPEPASPLMLALAEWPLPDGAASAARAVLPPGGGLPARLPSTIPSALRAALTAPAAEPVPAPAPAPAPVDVLAPAAAFAPASPPSASAAASTLASTLASTPASGPAAPSTPGATSPAPAVALKALGYSQATDGSVQVVLSVGNTLYVVNEGQEFLDRFRVVSVHPEGIDVEDRLSNHTIHLNFGP